MGSVNHLSIFFLCRVLSHTERTFLSHLSDGLMLDIFLLESTMLTEQIAGRKQSWHSKSRHIRAGTGCYVQNEPLCSLSKMPSSVAWHQPHEAEIISHSVVISVTESLCFGKCKQPMISKKSTTLAM